MSDNKNFPLSLGHIQFLLLGITSLLGYNAVMNTLDYFASKYNYNVYFLLTIPYIAFCVATSAIIFPLSKKFSIKLRLSIGLWSSAIVTILLPIIAQFSPNDFGFYLTMCILMPLLGITNSLVTSSGFAFAAIFCSKYPQFITTYNTGTGLAGILLSLMRIIVIAGFQDKKSLLGYQVLIFFGSATILVLMAVLCNAKFMTNSAVKQSMKQNLRNAQTTENSEVQIEYEDWIQIPNNIETNLIKSENGKKNWKFLVKTFINTQPYMILLLIVYIQTYLLYPGMIIDKIFVPDMSNSWKLVLLTLSFNCFDTFGKFISQYNQKLRFQKTSSIVFVLLRFAFFPIVFMSIFTKAQIFESVWYPFVIMALFAFTNGILTGVTMILGPSNVKQEAQETAGFLMSFALVTGILIGMFSALPFQNFTNVNVSA